MSRRVLIYNHPELGEQRFELEVGGSYRIGARSDNDIVLPQKDVSRRHAILHVGTAEMRITDLNSKNGTFINGRRVSSEPFHCGDRLALSSAVISVIDMSTGSFQMSPETGTAGPAPRDPESREDTVQERQDIGREGLVGLLEATAESVSHANVTSLLTWIVDRFGVKAAMVIRADESDRCAVVANAGEWGELLGSTARFQDMARRVRHAVEVTGNGVKVIEVQEMTVGLALDPDRTLILELRDRPPSTFEVRVITAAVRTVLRSRDQGPAASSSGRSGVASTPQGTVRVIGRPEAIRSSEEPASTVEGAVSNVDNLSESVAASDSKGDDPTRLDVGPGIPLAQAVERFERELIRRALQRSDGNRTRAAEQLGLTRAGLFKKMRRLGMLDQSGVSSE